MAKKIKFPLEMKNGIQVRTLDELQENFDVEKTIGYLLDGKLKTWLEDRYYDHQANEISKLDIYAPDINEKLGVILGIDPKLCTTADVDVEEIEKQKKRLVKLKAYTDNESIWDKIKYVAFDQEELACLLDECCNEIYLCGENFQIPYSIGNISYIGVNQPKVFINADGEIDLDEQNISFDNITILNDDVGNADYYYDKGMSFLWGRNGKEKDNEKAFYYLKKAHDKGHIDAAVRILCAMYDVNESFFTNRLDPRAIREDYKFLNKEGVQKYRERADYYILMNGYHMIPKDVFNEDDIHKLEEKVDEFIEKGSTLAIYLKGILIEKHYYINYHNFDYVLFWRKALDKGVSDAAYILGKEDHGPINAKLSEEKKEYLKKGIKLKSAKCACELAYWSEGNDKRKYIQLAMDFEKTGVPSGNGMTYCIYADMCESVNDKIFYYEKAVEYKNTEAMEKLILIYFYGLNEQKCDIKKAKEYSVMLLNCDRRYGYMRSENGIIPFITGILLYKGDRVERNIYEGMAKILDTIDVLEFYYLGKDYNYYDDDYDEWFGNELNLNLNDSYINRHNLLKNFIEKCALDLIKENITEDVEYAYWITGGLIYVQTQINGTGQDICIYFVEYDKLFNRYKGKLLYTINSSYILAYKPVYMARFVNSFKFPSLYLLVAFLDWGTAVRITRSSEVEHSLRTVKVLDGCLIEELDDFKVTSINELDMYTRSVDRSDILYYGCKGRFNKYIMNSW